ncbi:MAG: sulfatase-like hydrolase/transferase [Lachnospiraceae bacterium]|nr:sulfatase-like hydrolase/transferase [Lachnospiraceae bacterium]
MINYSFLILILYYELLFKLYSGTGTGAFSFLIIALFSLSIGAILSILSGLTKNGLVNRIVSGIILFVTPVIYLVQYFVYRSFNVFYDINTMTNGAGQAFTGFAGDILRIVISFEGISAILLFFLPFFAFIAFAIIKRDKEMMPGLSRRSFAVLALSAAAFFVLGRLAVSFNDIYRSLYSSEYNYQNAVSSMGLATGLRLDIMHLIAGDTEEFVFVDTDVDTDIADTGDDAESVIDSADDDTYTETDQDSSSDASSADNAPDSVSDITSESSSADDDTPPDKKSDTASESSTADADTVTENISDTASASSSADADAEERSFAPNCLNLSFKKLAEGADGTEKQLDLYVDTIEPSMQNEFTGLFKGKNLIFLTAEAFSGYILDPELTPALYRLATKGIQIPDYYQPASAGTTGGEYSNLFGMIPTAGGKSMKKITEHNTWITMGNRLSAEGYYGMTYHDNNKGVYERDVTHEKLGYSGGFMGVGNGMEEYLHTSGFPASDLEMLQGTFPTYADKQPFNIYYMTVSGHGQYGRSINQMASKNYSRVENLDHSEIVKCYLACNMPLEDAMAWLLDELEKRNMADDTVIVISADHFPYNLDTGASPGNMPNLSELYGFEVTNYLERDSNRLIIWSGCLEKMDPIVIDSPVFSLDILPTLCNLFGVKYESRLLPGRDIFSDKEAIIFDSGYDWKTDLGTYIASKNRFTPVSENAEIPDGYVERIRAEVKNRMNYCKGVLNCGYFDHVFGKNP